MQIMDKTKMLEGLIRHYTKGNKAQFAKLLGVSAQTISAWIARNTFDAELIYAKCRYVDSSWLLTGEGSMLQVAQQAEPTVPKHRIEIARQVPHGSSEGIPLIPLDAVAGFPAESGGGVRLEDCERYVIPEFENKGANFLIRVSGDSMVPLYYSGDLLACRKITDIRFFQWGTVYVLETSQGVLVKRVQESVDHADSILCVSENSSVHHPFLLPRDDIRSLSIIVGLVRLV